MTTRTPYRSPLYGFGRLTRLASRLLWAWTSAFGRLIGRIHPFRIRISTAPFRVRMIRL